jgi:hypothetical protein
MVLNVGSVVTEKTICEFELLRQTLSMFHECRWILSCDQASYDRYSTYKNFICLKLIETDDCDHNIQDNTKKENWMKVMMTKFDVADYSIKNFGNILFLDCDMIFVNPIEESVLKLVENRNIDAFVCQHMTNDWQNEAKHGLFNAGMFFASNISFIKEWKTLSSKYKELNLYFEQQPLEYIQRNFVTLNLPINYNIGWWRFFNSRTIKRLDLLNLVDERIYFGNRPAVNFHVHTLKEISYGNFGQFLVDKIKILLASSNNQNYKKILSLIDE